MSEKIRSLRYQEVISRILKYIEEHQIQPDGRLPSERELREYCQASQPTINKAVACLISEGQLRREGYKLFLSAPETKTNTPRNIHILCPHAHYDRITPVRHDLIAAAHDVCSTIHANIIPLLARTPAEQRQQLIGLLSAKVDGFAIWQLPHSSLQDLYQQFQQRNIPFVVCDLDPGHYSYVGTDNDMGAALAVQHLIDLGHREIAYITDSLNVSTLQARAQGYQHACFTKNLKKSMNRVFECTEISEAEATRIFLELRQRHPEVTAISCSNDLLALDIMNAAHRNGIRVPEQFSIVGFDDIDISSMSNPPLTTVAQDFYTLGILAVEALCRSLRNAPTETVTPVRIRLEPKLIVRGSTRKITGG